MPISRVSISVFLIAACACTAPAAAQPGWGGRGWGAPAERNFGRLNASNAPDNREGKVDSDHFEADGAAAALGHGAVEVVSAPGGTADPSNEAVYEAALVDQLVKAGYDTAKPDPTGGQVAEIRIIRDVLVPEEAPHKPVSGEMSVGVSNRGSMVGMAVAVDMTKPRKALISTRLEARIRDRASGTPLWEGHATIATREGDSHWTETAIADRLAAALFEGFRAPSTAVSRR